MFDDVKYPKLLTHAVVGILFELSVVAKIVDVIVGFPVNTKLDILVVDNDFLFRRGQGKLL